MRQSMGWVAKYVSNAENKNSSHSWEEMRTETDLSVTFWNAAHLMPNSTVSEDQAETGLV